MGVELTGRVAIVTGAAQGIGEAAARRLADRGAIVVGLDNLTIADWHTVMALNLHAPFYLSLAVAPIMKAQRRGRIITVGSGAGRSHSRSRVVPYAAAKAGVHGLMRQLAVELAPFNVLCNLVAPGLILSPHGVADWARRSEAEKAMERSTIAIQRLGDPSEIANVIAFVASDEASYVAGQTLMVDGGHWIL